MKLKWLSAGIVAFALGIAAIVASSPYAGTSVSSPNFDSSVHTETSLVGAGIFGILFGIVFLVIAKSKATTRP